MQLERAVFVTDSLLEVYDLSEFMDRHPGTCVTCKLLEESSGA